MGFLDSLPSDAALVSRALSDKYSAFESLALRYQQKAYAIARAIGVPSSSVDDVVQESFLQAFCGLRGLRAPASFGPWFLSIVRNLSRKELERSRRPLDPVRLESRPPSEPRVDAMDLEELREHLWREVGNLPEGIREAIFLYYHEGESVRRVARTLEVSTSAVKSRLQRGRDQLREKLWRDLEESLREMLPSTREWRLRGRRLTLLIAAAVLPANVTPGADLAGAAAARDSGGLLHIVTTGVSLMSLKKLGLVLGLAAVLITGSIALVSQSLNRPPEDGRQVTDSGGVEPLATLTVEAHPRDEGPAVPAPAVATPVTGITGTVFLQNAPAPAADVLVAAILDGERRHAMVAATGADGAYTLPGLRPGKYRLWAWKEDWTTRSPWSDDHEVEVREGELAPGKDLTLVPGVIVEGRVVEEGTHRPIPAATVELGSLQFTAADDEGRFRLEGLPEGLIGITARARGYVRGSLQLDAAHGETPSVTIEVSPGGHVEGTVKEAAGAPAPGVEVTIWAGSIYESARTDAEGRYGIDGIPLTARNIELSGSRGGCFAATATLAGFPPGDARIVHDLQLEEGYTLRGRIVGAGGEPVEGAEIQIRGSMSFRHFLSDGEGRFVIEGASGRMSTLSARKKGHALASLSLRDLSEEGREKIELALGESHFVEGTIVDTGGVPVEDVVVFVDLENRVYPPPMTRTDAGGRFRVEDLPETSLGLIGAQKEGYASNYSDLQQADQRDMRLVLHELGQIQGIVVDKGTGAPVHPFVVKITMSRDRRFSEENVKHGRGGVRATVARDGLSFTSPDGRFKIRNELVPEIYYKLLVVAPGHGDTALDGVEAWPRSESREPIRVEVEKGKPLRGRLVAAGTRDPVAGARVSHVGESGDTGRGYWHEPWRGQDTPVRVSITDANGEFLLEGLSQAPGVLLLEKPGFARTAVFEAAPSPRVQVFELAAASSIEGTVRNAAGEPIEGASVQASVEGQDFPDVTTNARGFYRIDGLPAGAAKVEMSHRPSLGQGSAAALSPGAVTVLDFTQGSGAILALVTERGQPVPNAKVFVMNLKDGRRQLSVVADGQGRSRIDGLDPGSYQVKASRPDDPNRTQGSVSRKVEVGTGEVPCEISLTPNGGLNGRVLDRLSGNPVSARLTLFKHEPGLFSGGGIKFPGSDWAPRWNYETRGDDARFHLDITAAGSYLIWAEAGGETGVRGWLGPVDLEPEGQVDDLTVHVGGPAALTVTLRDAKTGTPVEGCWIILRPGDGYPMGLSTKSDASGLALYSSAPAGKYRLEVQPPAHTPHFEDVDLGEVQVAREISLVPACWIAVKLGGSVNPFRHYLLKATLISGDDPAWPLSSTDGRSLVMESTKAERPEPGAQDLKLRLKTRPGRYTIHFEVGSLSLSSAPIINQNIILTQDVVVEVPEAGEGAVRLLLPEN